MILKQTSYIYYKDNNNLHSYHYVNQFAQLSQISDVHKNISLCIFVNHFSYDAFVVHFPQ